MSTATPRSRFAVVGPQLQDVVVLSSRFRMWPDPPAPMAADDPNPFVYPEGDFLTLAAATKRSPRGLVLYLQADIDDFAIPFSLSLLLAARFELAEGDVEREDLESTLVSLCYPFLRELVADITGRSPMPPYELPARTPAHFRLRSNFG